VSATWDASTRPLLEAFFHARYFLEMAVKYGAELDEPPTTLPSGWAGLLYLYNLRWSVCCQTALPTEVYAPARQLITPRTEPHTARTELRTPVKL